MNLVQRDLTIKPMPKKNLHIIFIMHAQQHAAGGRAVKNQEILQNAMVKFNSSSAKSLPPCRQP